MRCALAAAPANTSATIAMLPTVAIPPPRSADHAAPRPERPSATTAAITVTPACPSTTPKASRRACGRSIASTLYKSRSRGSKEPLFLRFEHGASGLLSSAVQALKCATAKKPRDYRERVDASPQRFYLLRHRVAAIAPQGFLRRCR